MDDITAWSENVPKRVGDARGEGDKVRECVSKIYAKLTSMIRRGDIIFANRNVILYVSMMVTRQLICICIYDHAGEW